MPFIQMILLSDSVLFLERLFVFIWLLILLLYLVVFSFTTLCLCEFFFLSLHFASEFMSPILHYNCDYVIRLSNFFSYIS